MREGRQAESHIEAPRFKGVRRAWFELWHAPTLIAPQGVYGSTIANFQNGRLWTDAEYGVVEIGGAPGLSR